MKNFKNQMLYLVFLLFVDNFRNSETFSLRNVTPLKRHSRASDCKIYGLKITNCDIEVSRFGNERIQAKYEKSCNIKDIGFNFNFGKEGLYTFSVGSTEPVVTVSEMKKKLESAAKIFSPGTHFISVSMKAKSLKNEEMSASSGKCKFYIRHENATASLGRLNRIVKGGQRFFVDASRSMNNDLEERNLNLEFIWSCNSSTSFCEDFDFQPDHKIKVLKEYVTEGATFNVTVQVRSLPTAWQTAQQFITVDSSSPFVVNCVQECGKYPNTFSPNLEPIVLAECEFSCNEYKKNLIHGAIYDDEENVVAAFDNFVDAFSISLKMKEGTNYVVKAFYGEITDNKILGHSTFFVLRSPRLENCKTIPPKGTPLTKFKVQCDFDEESKKNFEIQVKSDETVVYSASSLTLEDIEFLVSSQNATVNVKLTDIHDVYSERQIKVDIESLIKETKNVTSMSEHLNDIYEGKVEGSKSVKDLIKSGDHKEAVQIIDVVAREMSKMNVTTEEDKKVVKGVKKTMLDDLGKIHIADIDLSKSVSGVIKHIATDHRDNVSDSDMAKILSDSCSAVAKQQLYLVQNDREAVISQSEVVDITRNLMSCGESEMSPYYEMFNETAIDLELTTRYPINENLSEKNFEDYPQYVADDLIEDKVNDFLSAAKSMVDICRDMASSLIYSFPSDMDQPIYITRENSVVSVMKTTGTKLVNTTFIQHNITIKPSQFLMKFRSTVSMQVCSYLRDPFWSASQIYKIPTNVIDVRVKDEADDHMIKKFHGLPMDIYFQVFEDLVEKKLSKGKVRAPNETSEIKEDEYTIFMVKARAEESFFIDFHNVGENEKFEVVIKPMERPQLDHFSDPYHVNHFDDKFFIEHLNRQDDWFLLAIKPDEDMENLQEEYNIEFSIYTPKCVAWNSEERTWKFACSVYLTTTPESIHCRCMHLSTIAGAFEYNDLKIHPKFTRLEFELEDAQSFYVIIAVCILIGAYFFLLVYTVQKNETLEDVVYLMSDVPAENRFAYLVIIQTGGRIDSGTTSDIVIQLLGVEAESQAHVINFPDPLLELLQRRQKDYFVLASPVYLGKLYKIHLWFDCTGSSPTWFCKKVRICDMQKKEWYAFKVNKWFKVEGKPRVFISVNATTDKENKQNQKKRYRLLSSVLSFGRFDNTIWHLSTSTTNPNFGYPKRLTLILSVLITLMMVTMEFYGRPEFIARDSITPNCYFKMRKGILYKGLYSALITFFPHLMIMEGFKNSRIQFQSKSSRAAKSLPTAFTIVFWVILILNITIQVHVLLIYGFKMVAPTTWEWMVSTALGFIFYVFILDYLYNLFLILVSGAVPPVKMNFEKIIKNIERQRKVLYKFIGRYIYRPILSPIYEVMSRGDYVRKRIHFRQRREMVWQVHDFFMIITFILLLYIIVLGEKDPMYDYRGHEEAMKLIYGVASDKQKLRAINHVNEFESYMEEGLIPKIQSYQWYGRYVSNSPGMTTDACNKYMGVIRLRQHRVEDDSCLVTEQMKFLNTKCRAPDYFLRYDFLNYTPAWNNTIPEVHKSRLGYVWGHQSGVGKMFVGLTGFYESGGYVADLGRTIENSLVNFNYLKRYNWLDPLTRAIIIEFCLYNVNNNHFHFAEVVLERTPTGYISKDVTVKTERVVKHSSKSQKIALIFSIIFMGLILGLCIRTTIRIIKTRVWYKRDLWHIVDVLIIILGLAWVGLYFKRLEVLREFVNSLEESPSNAFVDYFPILNVESWMRILAALLICTSTIRMWKIVRFGVIFRTVERTLLLSAFPLSIMFFYYTIIFIAFGVAMYITLGSKVGQFRDVYHIGKTLLFISIGFDKTDPDEVALNERGLGYMFTVLYSIYCQFITTIFIAILCVEYIKARQFAFEEKLDYNLKDFTIERFKLFKRMGLILARKFRLTAGGEPTVEDELISPKDDMLRYKNCVQTDSNRMKAMASVAKCVLLKLKKGLRTDESDHSLMMRTVRNLCSQEEGEKEMFFVEGTKDSGLIMVDDKRLLKMERVVKRMLETPEGKAQRMDKLNTEDALKEDNLARMMKMNYQLKLMNKVVKNIEIITPSNRKVL